MDYHIVEEPTGFYLSPTGLDYWDVRGKAYPTKAAAFRACDPADTVDGRRIPARYRPDLSPACKPHGIKHCGHCWLSRR